MITTPTPTATEPASPTNPLPAVLRDTGGITGQACLAPENAAKTCVELQSSDVTVRGGIAVFGLSSGAGGVAAVYGRTQAGEWKPWFRTQNAFSLLFLPGDVRICADGDGLNVREQASLAGPVLTTLADDTIARAEEFVLDTAASSDRTRGFGWYRLTTPAEGWAHSEFLAAAAEGNCTTRNAQVGSTSTPPADSTTTPTAGAR
ncbi:MAG: SH3 domain-containing protein [Dehalococcoidia bacterium]|nr:SH3 domain-containing protein [Dehalococcoidia bacterium]MCB9486263.1 SH3 domain-containing protein [Thermoflexaceae bacterium]